MFLKLYFLYLLNRQFKGFHLFSLLSKYETFLLHKTIFIFGTFSQSFSCEILGSFTSSGKTVQNIQINQPDKVKLTLSYVNITFDTGL